MRKTGNISKTNPDGVVGNKKTQEVTNGVGEWISRKQGMTFLGYHDNKMAELEKSGAIEYSKVGRRKFMRRVQLFLY